MNVEIGKEGKILEGDLVGYSLRVEDDLKLSRGFCIRVLKDANDPNSEVLNTWVESFDALNSFVRDENWEVEWH